MLPFYIHILFFFPLPDATKVHAQSDRYFGGQQTGVLIRLGPELKHQIQALSVEVEDSSLDLTLKFSPCINEIILILSSFWLNFDLRSCSKEEFSDCQKLWTASASF